MASKRSTEQCMTWLRSKAADRDSLDGINAELTINVITEQKNRIDKLGMQYQKVKNDRDRMMHEIEVYVNNDLVLTDAQRQYLIDNGVELIDF